MFYGKTNKEIKPKPKPSRETWLFLKEMEEDRTWAIDGMVGWWKLLWYALTTKNKLKISEEPNKQNTK